MEEEEETLQGESNEKIEKWYTVDRYMLPAKLSYFLNNARYSICDYFVLFYVQAGLTPFEAGLVNGLQHIGGIIAAPLFGMLADKYGFHRLITICLCAMSIMCVCIQPYCTATFGDADNNFCPPTTNKSNTTESREFSLDNRLFYSLFTSAIFASSFDASIMSFNEAGVLQKVKSSPRQSNIGTQRIPAAIGSSLGSVAYSLSIYYFPKGNISCYVGMFVTYFIFAICLATSFYFLFRGISIEKEERISVTKQLFAHLKNFHTLFFLVTVLFNGIVPAVMFSYLFLYLKQLNASTLLFGASISFNCVSGTIIYAFSSKLINLLGGSVNAMCASCFAWAIRLVCIAYLVNPYYVLLIDIFHGFTFSLFKVASLEYITEETDVAIYSSMCGVVNALSYSCSFLIASVAGGKLYEIYGPEKLFLGTSVACVVWGVLMVIYIFNMRKSNRQKESD